MMLYPAASLGSVTVFVLNHITDFFYKCIVLDKVMSFL